MNIDDLIIVHLHNVEIRVSEAKRRVDWGQLDLAKETVEEAKKSLGYAEITLSVALKKGGDEEEQP